jgi:hypothetical protein
MQDGTLLKKNFSFNSFLSFEPLVTALKKNIAEGNPGMQKLYGQIIQQFEMHPELMKTITELSVIESHSELIEELLSAVFPPTTANFMYGVSIPFKSQAVYASPFFKKLLLKQGTQEISIPESQNGTGAARENLHFAYGLILKKYLGYNSPNSFRTIYPVPDNETGLTRFMELRLDGRFITVNPTGEMPQLPESILDQHNNKIMTVAELMEHIPIEQFSFEGIAVMRVNDMTEQAIISEIKNRLIDNNAFADAGIYRELEEFIQSLIGLKGLSIGITPFFKINGHYIYSELHNNNSLLFRHFQSIADKDEISDYCKLLFRENNQPLLFATFSEQSLNDIEFLKFYHKEGGRSLIVCPLKHHNELIGMLEIISEIPGQLIPFHISKIEEAIPLFTLGLQKSLDLLNSEVDGVIKKKFTAVQPAVEWKFTETALNYIVSHHQKEDAKIERINFPDVFPLYGAIDIRNSSTERSHSIQLDILDQLQLARNIVVKAQAEIPFPLLQEIQFKINIYYCCFGCFTIGRRIKYQGFYAGPGHLSFQSPARY